jgi:glycosyltransferase involved in cell wall biosynthesis
MIPIFNAQKVLIRTLDSVKNQTFEDFEVICVNDGSTDGSEKIIKDYVKKDSRFKLVSKQNGGIGSARNAALSKATGRFFMTMDHDDLLVFDALEKLVKYANDYDVVCGRNICASENELVIPETSKAKIEFVSQNPLGSFLNKKIKTPTWNKLYKPHLFKNFKFPENVIYEDAVATPDLLARAKSLLQLSNITYVHFIFQGTAGSKEFKKDYLKDAVIRANELYERQKNVDVRNLKKYENYRHKQFLGVLDFYKNDDAKLLDVIREFKKLEDVGIFDLKKFKLRRRFLLKLLMNNYFGLFRLFFVILR